MVEYNLILLSKPLDGRLSLKMSAKHFDLLNAVSYHYGRFPPDKLNYEALISPLGDAASSLARYDARMSGLVNSDLLLAPLQRQDAVISSRIEGTISTIEEIYQLEAEENAGNTASYQEARHDVIETLLYSRALWNAQKALDEGSPFSEHLIRTAHQQLLSFGRGARKQPGSYKSEQNYIGESRLGKIYYIPIAPEQLGPAMTELVHFINHGMPHPLIRAAIAHVEFEALHPFQDGNGRIGRMLITLMLWKLGILSRPNFFISGYFETHKEEYIEKMRLVSEKGDWTGWIIFFLHALHEQAIVNTQTAEAILNLYNNMREKFREILNSQYHDQALDYVFSSPIFRNNSFIAKSGIPAASARALSRRLMDAELIRLVEPASGRKAALYAFDPLLELLKI